MQPEQKARNILLDFSSTYDESINFADIKNSHCVKGRLGVVLCFLHYLIKDKIKMLQPFLVSFWASGPTSITPLQKTD